MAVLTKNQVVSRLVENYFGRFTQKFNKAESKFVNTDQFIGELVMLGLREDGFTIWAKNDNPDYRNAIRTRLIEIFADADNVEIDEHGTGTLRAGNNN
jgi:hypothetical protein